jgi:hypothetical protein
MLQVFHQRTPLEGAGRGGPLGLSSRHVRVGSQAGATAGAKHKVVSMGVPADVEHEVASMLGCSLSLSSLLIRARCGLSAAISRASNSMRAAGVCGHTWLIDAKLLMAAGAMISPYKRARSNRDPAQRLGEGARKDTVQESQTRGGQHAWGHPDALLASDIRALDVLLIYSRTRLAFIHWIGDTSA